MKQKEEVCDGFKEVKSGVDIYNPTAFLVASTTAEAD
jgi:hypothetical protein